MDERNALSWPYESSSPTPELVMAARARIAAAAASTSAGGHRYRAPGSRTRRWILCTAALTVVAATAATLVETGGAPSSASAAVVRQHVLRALAGSDALIVRNDSVARPLFPDGSAQPEREQVWSTIVGGVSLQRIVVVNAQGDPLRDETMRLLPSSETVEYRYWDSVGNVYTTWQVPLNSVRRPDVPVHLGYFPPVLDNSAARLVREELQHGELIITGRTSLDGRQALRLAVVHEQQANQTVLVVDAVSYLPIELKGVFAKPKTRDGHQLAVTVDNRYSWTPASPATEQRTFWPPLPNGAREVSPTQFGHD